MRANILLIMLCLVGTCFSDFRSGSNEIRFKTTEGVKAILNDHGLGLGVSPSATLHVNGNAFVSRNLSLGANQTSNSNLMVSGTFGHLPSVLVNPSDGVILNDSSITMIDSSANMSVVLPSPETVEGRIMRVININPLVDISVSTMVDKNHFPRLMGSGINSIEIIALKNGWRTISQQIHSRASIPSSNLKLWYDASDIDADHVVEGLSESGLSSGNVILWKNKAESATHDLNNGVGVAPQYVSTDTLHGRSEVRFDNDKQNMLLSADAFTVGNKFTLMVAGNLFKPTVNGRDYLLSVASDDFYLGRHNTKNGIIYKHVGGTTDYQQSALDVLSISSDNVNSSYKMYSGNVQKFSSDISFNWDGVGVSSQIALGSRRTNEHNLGSTSDVYEILFFDKILNTQEFEALVAYLNLNP